VFFCFSPGRSPLLSSVEFGDTTSGYEEDRSGSFCLCRFWLHAAGLFFLPFSFLFAHRFLLGFAAPFFLFPYVFDFCLLITINVLGDGFLFPPFSFVFVEMF